MIEQITTIYRPLFTVTFIHTAYQTAQENFFTKGMTVTPDAQTKKLFTNYKMDYRLYNNTLTCFIQCVLFNPPVPEPKSPFVSIAGNIRIRFLLHNSSDFFDKTVVTAGGSKKRYSFSNRINNVVGSVLFLSNAAVIGNADLQDAAIVDADEDCFGVIDVYNSGTTNNSYNLFGAGGVLFAPAPAYTLTFQSSI
jgi:hypothetical protein